MIQRRIAVLVAIVCALLVVPTTTSAQDLSASATGITAVGVGVATAPAETAKLQFYLGSAMTYGSGGMYFSEPATELGPNGEGTPSAEPGFAPVPTDSLDVSVDQLQPVVDALVAAGVTEADITVTAPLINDSYGSSSPRIGEIVASITQPEADQLTSLVDTVFDAAGGAGLAVLTVGALYEPADCDALIQEARTEAIADAQERAQGLADGLGVSLGELTQVVESPFFGLIDGGSCGPDVLSAISGPFGAGSYPSFNHHQTDATVLIQVSLTYTMGSS